MGNIVENPVWEETVFQVEVTTPLLGGSVEKSSFGTPTAGYLNVAQQQLANRTQYLKETLENTDVDVGGLSDRVDTVETSLTAHIGSRGAAHTNSTQTEAGFMSAADKTKLNGVETGAQVNVATNLAQGTRTTTTVPVTSSTGTSATLDIATTSLAGVMSSADKTKLDGVATGAQVNTVTSVAGKTGVVTLVKGDVGLGNVDNTADTAKPVSTAQQTALDLKANLASPPLTGTPTAPTATVGTNTTQIATTAFVLANASSISYMQVQDQKSANTQGGSATGGSYLPRTLNTIVTNQIAGASLSADTVTLPAGTYFIDAESEFSAVNQVRLALFNGATQVSAGVNNLMVTGAGGTAKVSAFLVFAGTAQIQLKYRVITTTATSGLGTANNFGDTEIYSQLNIWKLS